MDRLTRRRWGRLGTNMSPAMNIINHQRENAERATVSFIPKHGKMEKTMFRG